MSTVKEAVERLLSIARGGRGFVLIDANDADEPTGMAEAVLVRRDDLQLLLATWGEKRA